MQILEITEPGQTPLPHAGEAAPAVGIDLGTTNSLVAIARDTRPEVLRDPDGDGMLPSVAAYGADGSVMVGTAARLALLDRPEAVVSSIKRLMGRSYEDIAQGEAVGGQLPLALRPSADGRMVHVAVAGRELTPVEISADILRALKARAEHALGREVDRAVITVPAYFDDAARTATRDAARLAGLTVLRLVNEPTAAALAYGLDKGAEGLYAIYDLGGGTFDVSILKLEKGVFQVLATGGDHKLGGDDFDNAIVADVLRRSGGEMQGVAALKQAQALARDAKEWLSGHERGEWEFQVGGRRTKYQLDRARFEGLIRDLVARTVRTAERVLDDARLAPAAVKGVVLVGGSTRVPLVRREVERLFGRPPLGDINPDEVVALGAALQAEALTVGSDTLLLDVTPLSLGIETMGGLVEKVIPRNTPIPSAAAQDFTTYQDGQSAMLIHVVQGERELVAQNRSLARFELHGIPPMTAGAARIRVTFAVDADGLLAVSAEERTTGVQQSVEVKPSYGLSEEEMIRMLRESMEHGQADMEARLLAEARVEAERALLALRSALRLDGDLLSADERAAIDEAAASVETTVAAADRDAINDAAKALEAATQGFAERRMDRGIRAALKGVSLDHLAGRVSGNQA
ncbi:MAG TPA: Fe-S protein assembly chaperone HscA [Candidatus Sulfotelmatobacter sp.]|nr:Fe-S protein assembly chaperone HscA [Candidatus Sulfotelmatobacter sp.]